MVSCHYPWQMHPYKSFFLVKFFSCKNKTVLCFQFNHNLCSWFALQIAGINWICHCQFPYGPDVHSRHERWSGSVQATSGCMLMPGSLCQSSSCPLLQRLISELNGEWKRKKRSVCTIAVRPICQALWIILCGYTHLEMITRSSKVGLHIALTAVLGRTVYMFVYSVPQQ